MDNFTPGGPKPSFQGNWTCAKCGKAITNLPFEPKSDRPVECFDCHKQKMQQGGGYGGRR